MIEATTALGLDMMDNIQETIDNNLREGVSLMVIIKIKRKYLILWFKFKNINPYR